MTEQFQIALLQMTSVDSWEQNLAWIFSQLEAPALAEKLAQTECIFLPENCLYMRLVEGEKVSAQSMAWRGFQDLKSWARQNQTALHLGSVPLEINGRLYNSSLYIDAQGDMFPSYQKIHLFDIHLENQKPIRESDVFAHGTETAVLEVAGWRIGQSICYDIRFSELYLKYAKEQVDAIVIPAAFLQTTGQVHWKILNCARAIESQAFVISACQTGEHRNGSAVRKTYGHSLVVDPWGEVLLDADLAPGLFFCTLDRQKISRVRTQIPMKNHRRLIST